MSAQDFEEVGHCGGKVTVTVRTDDAGSRTYQLRLEHSRSNRAAFMGIYVLPQGVPVADINMAGMGVPWSDPPISGCLPVLIASDSEGMFGHRCPSCSAYWRSRTLPRICPYCSEPIAGAYALLTDAQLLFVKRFCALMDEALHKEEDGDYVVDMDAVADAVGQEADLPPFYYSEQRQQTLMTCRECTATQDILGRFSYCCRCGTRNDLTELVTRLDQIRTAVQEGRSPESAVRDAVSAFDSVAAQLGSELVRRVPLLPARAALMRDLRGHNFDRVQQAFNVVFGIDIGRGIGADDQEFLRLMFHRRHVYEHKGGEADAKYIADSGDNVRPKQRLRETAESAHRTLSQIRRLGENLFHGFHQILPANEEASGESDPGESKKR